MTVRIRPAGLSLLALTLTAALGAATPALDLTPVVLRGNVHPAIAAGKVLGTVPRSAPMDKMILSLKASPEALTRRDAFLRDQQDPKSPSFHKWLTPAQFCERFSPAPKDVQAITAWLKGHGFHIDQLPAGGTSIVFSGSAGAVMDSFSTTLAEVEVDGVRRQGNLTDPSIPAAFTGLVDGIVSLNNVPRKAMNHGATRVSDIRVVNPHYTSSDGSHYLAPGDFATIYNTRPLLDQGIDGTGITIAIAGRTDILTSDFEAFRRVFKLPAHKLAITYNGANPGINNDESEADLDVQWSSAAAPGATVQYVCSGSTNTADGIDLSILYIVNNNLAPVMSVSYGGPEAGLGAAAVAWFNNAWAQAAAQGISVFVSSGDDGAAGGARWGYYGPGINGIGSSSNNVCVGGTQFNEGSGTYWSASNSADHSSALGYIPEAVWNESQLQPGGSGDWASGGGYSLFTAQPWWQNEINNGHAMRAVPDVSLTAASHDGYYIAQEGFLWIIGGTSASSPSFAGLMALVVQATGQRQGNPNPVLYQLANGQYLGEGPAVFHDCTVGDNTVPDSEGFAAVPGYDAATGLGSVNAKVMIDNWPLAMPHNTITGAAITSPADPMVTFSGGGTVTFTAAQAVDSDPAEILTYTWVLGDGSIAYGPSVTHTYTTGSGTSVYPVTLTVSDSTGNLAADTRQIQVKTLALTGSATPVMPDLLQWAVYFTGQDLRGDLNGDGTVDDTDLQILLGAL